MKKIATINNIVTLSKIADTLEQNDIAFYQKNEGSEEFLKIYSGMTFRGTSIYVADEDYDVAKHIVDYIVNEENAPEEATDEAAEDETDSNMTVKWYQNKRVVARVILGFWVVIMIIAFFVH